MVNAMRLCCGESQNEQRRKRDRETAQPTASTERVHCLCSRFLPDVARQRKRNSPLTSIEKSASPKVRVSAEQKAETSRESFLNLSSPNHRFCATLLKTYTSVLHEPSTHSAIPQSAPRSS